MEKRYNTAFAFSIIREDMSNVSKTEAGVKKILQTTGKASTRNAKCLTKICGKVGETPPLREYYGRFDKKGQISNQAV